MYRVVKLYRPAVGSLWWLQSGEWIETNGAMGIATGRPKRRFVVNWEASFRTHEDALRDLAYYEARAKNPPRRFRPAT